MHSDLKTPNVLLGDRHPSVPDRWPVYPSAYLADFGLAEPGTQIPNFNDLSGSWGYRAPEKCSRKPAGVPLQLIVDEKSDVWTVGVLLYCLMELQPDPNDGLQWEDPTGTPLGSTIHNRLNHVWTLLSNDYSNALKKAVMDCMAFQRNHRSSFGELAYNVKSAISLLDQAQDQWVQQPQVLLGHTLPQTRNDMFGADGAFTYQLRFSPAPYQVGREVQIHL